jgi:hypothetical protein
MMFSPDPGGSFLSSQGLPSPQNGFGLFPKNTSAAGQFVSNFDPLGGFILDGLFGGQERPPRPFTGTPFRNDPGIPTYDPLSGYFQGLQDQNGQINPVTPYVPNKVERSGAASTRALINTLPATLQAINAQILPNELSQLQSSSITSPAYAKLQQDIYRSNALSNADVEKQLLLGPGMDVVNIANELQRSIDPEYYRTRESQSNQINQALNNGMTGSEQADVERGIGRGNARSGTLGLGSNLQTLSAGQRFGNVGRDRLLQLLQQANQFSGGARSGVDVLQQAVKSPSAISGAYSNVQQGAGNQAVGVGNNVSNQLYGLTNTMNQLNAQKPKTIDRIFQGLQAAGSIAGSFI